MQLTCCSKTTNQLQKAFSPIIYWFNFSNTINDFEVYFIIHYFISHITSLPPTDPKLDAYVTRS